MSLQGDSGLGGSEFILFEADCSDDSEDARSNIEENCTVETDFICDETVDQGNSLEVFQGLTTQDCAQHIASLKRKYVSTPKDSRRVLQAINNNSPRSKRRLSSENCNNEALVVSSPNKVDKENGGGVGCQVTSLLRSSNLIASLLARFKVVSGIGWKEVTREFKNNRTTTLSWVVACFEVHETVYESACELLKTYCEYFLCRRYVYDNYNVCLYLCEFNVAKCKVTVHGLFKTILGVDPKLTLADPPRIRSPLCAMFWFKSSLTQGSYTFGNTPEWLAKQTVIGHQSASEAAKFDLTEMVQWAYDMEYREASEIAFYYAQEAHSNPNAAAWLASANQAKYVRDCETMLHHYLKAELSQMSMSEYIFKQCQRCNDKGSWLPIMNLFRHQEIEPICFVSAMKDWLKGTPKKNTIFFIGRPDTGKSMLTNSLMKFLRGQRLSFAMHKSTFWMQPLASCKAALIDDATHPCLGYFDSHLRNILDGYPVCVDRKYKRPIEIKAPPLMVTTNIDIGQDPRYYYLRSRATCFYFNNELPIDENGNPLYCITDDNWANFFKRLWSRLGLEDREEVNNGSMRAFNIVTRTGNGPD
ncbi:E1 early protein [Bos taurus papillomavirus 33]|nr:E1 early protein [Bos taurus papillomavirus 33]